MTDSLAPGFSTFSPSPYLSQKPINIPTANLHSKYNPRPGIRPQAISTSNTSDLSTPPLTPDDGSDFGSLELRSSPPISCKQENDTLDFLMNLFPRQGLQALPYATKVSISAPHMGASFDGVVLELPGQTKTFYVDGKSAESVSIRERCAKLSYFPYSIASISTFQYCCTLGPG